MTTTFQLNETEMNEQFLVALKSLFKGQNLTVTVESAEELDETAYLLSSPANRERLLQSIQNVKEGKNLIETDLTQLNALLQNA
jgi:antitoxin YefM